MRLLLVLAVFAITACKDPPPPPPPPPPPAPVVKKDPEADVKLTDEDRACSKDAECQLITTDCCTCNTLGSLTGVRKDRVEVVAKRREPICLGAFCPQAVSNDPSCNARRAICANGLCTPDIPGARAPAGTGVEPIK